jgi:opacity protein-like surface antigen
MKLMTYGAAVSAAVIMSAAVAAQSPSQQGPTSAPSPTQAQRPAPTAGATTGEQTVTVTGCVLREADFRKAQDAGRGGVAGTGVGVGNEFVLTNAVTAPASSSTAAGTATGSAFELTGPNEGQAASHVGKRVEVMGTLKAGEVSAAGPTGGPTAGAPPRGVDVASKDLQLRELEITSIKSSTGTCPA